MPPLTIFLLLLLAEADGTAPAMETKDGKIVSIQTRTVLDNALT